MWIKDYSKWRMINEEKRPGYYLFPKLKDSIYRKLKSGGWEVRRPGSTSFQGLVKGDVESRVDRLEVDARPVTLNLLFVGDSNTASAARGEFYGWWVDRLLDNPLDINSTEDRVTVETVAKGGEGTQWMIDNLTTHLASKSKGFYDIITILGGSNDIWNGTSPKDAEYVKTNIQSLVKLAEDHGARAVVISPPSKLFHTPRGSSTEGDKKLDELQKLVDWEKETYAGRFINFNWITSPAGGATEADFEADRRHLKPEPKHRELAQLWIQKIYWGAGPA